MNISIFVCLFACIKPFKISEMKILVISILVILSITSCESKKKSWERAKLHNIASEEKAKRDSIEQIKIDSIALFAWGDIKFGMSIQEVLSTKSFKDGKTITSQDGCKFSNRVIMNDQTREKIMEVLGIKQVSSFEALFNLGELSTIDIRSRKVTIGQTSKLIQDCDIFVKNFTQKYGEPQTLKKDISILDFMENNVFCYANYNLGSKNISIYFFKTDHDNKFYYNVNICNYIFDLKKMEKTLEEEVKEELENLKREKEEKEIKENSF